MNLFLRYLLIIFSMPSSKSLGASAELLLLLLLLLCYADTEKNLCSLPLFLISSYFLYTDFGKSNLFEYFYFINWMNA